MIREWLYRRAVQSRILGWIREKHPAFFNRLLSFTRKWEYQRIRVITIDSAVFITEKLCDEMPRDFDCVIGIPRAGLLFANIAAMKLGLPLSTPENFMRGEVWIGWNKLVARTQYKRILLFNDDVTDGKELGAVYKQLKDYDSSLDIKIAVISVNPPLKEMVDYHKIETFTPTVFEWSFIHHSIGRSLCTDMDGVLCKDEDHNTPYIIPRYQIDWILTGRSEAERPETESWLASHSVKYKQLIMLPLNEDDPIGYKIRVLRDLKPFWYWESSPDIARLIADRTGISVLCIADMKIYRLDQG